MLFDVNIYVAVQQSPRGIWLALAVVALAGISESVGQSLVLFINKSAACLYPAVLISLISYLAGYLLWTASVYAVGRYIFDAGCMAADCSGGRHGVRRRCWHSSNWRRSSANPSAFF